MSAPKKIYTYMDGSIRTILHKNTEKHIINNVLESSEFTTYILESEHDRIVGELKKQHTFDLDQARFAYALQAINHKKENEELMITLQYTKDYFSDGTPDDLDILLDRIDEQLINNKP